LRFADLHCDTPYELYKKKAHINTNNLHISIDKCECFQQYLQVAAIWSDCKFTDEKCYSDFFNILDYFTNEAAECICFNKKDLLRNSKVSFVLAVEDARLLNYNAERITQLYKYGIRFMTLTWKDKSCIGGAWNTEYGLSEFGKEAVNEMLKTGIIPDVSHGSRQLIRDVYSIAKTAHKPFVATHSNSFSTYAHKRNLDDEDARMIANSGGIIGISLCPSHISKNASMEDILEHIKRYIYLVGEDSISFGCDLDGISSLPDDVIDITSIKRIFSKTCQKFGENIAEKIFFNNTYNFLLNNI